MATASADMSLALPSSIADRGTSSAAGRSSGDPAPSEPGLDDASSSSSDAVPAAAAADAPPAEDADAVPAAAILITEAHASEFAVSLAFRSDDRRLPHEKHDMVCAGCCRALSTIW